MIHISLDGNSLSLSDVKNVAYQDVKIELTPEARQRIIQSQTFVEKLVSSNKTVYGINTGFGKLANKRITHKDIERLQMHLILSHSTGVGPVLPIPETRAIMLLRANTLAKGYSGIRLETLQTIIDMLNKKVYPLIPEKGSVGASGDLAPLSHIALVMLGKGKAYYNNTLMDGEKALQQAGIKPVNLKAKEGLALNNGTQVMTGILTLAYLQAITLCKSADIVGAMTVEALKGTDAAFDERIHNLRPHPGQIRSAKNLRNLLAESKIMASHRNCSKVQDPYSLRCMPQVHGAVYDAIDFIESILTREINAATDNPLIFANDGIALSGGNFHGEPVAFAADLLGIIIAELANISECRIEQMLNPALNNGLPPFLAPHPGLDSGFMLAQCTAASLVSENKTLAHPASVDSIPTSAGQEDHVSMGTIAARHAKEIVSNTAYVLAIELITATQALEYEITYESSKAIVEVKNLVRKHIAPLKKDRILSEDIEKAKNLLISGEILQAATKYAKIQ
ncbi:MAG: histidine ammonia-lyase [Candidatus Cloacimonadia bacterium]